MLASAPSSSESGDPQASDLSSLPTSLQMSESSPPPAAPSLVDAELISSNITVIELATNTSAVSCSDSASVSASASRMTSHDMTPACDDAPRAPPHHLTRQVATTPLQSPTTLSAQPSTSDASPDGDADEEMANLLAHNILELAEPALVSRAKSMFPILDKEERDVCNTCCYLFFLVVFSTWAVFACTPTMRNTFLRTLRLIRRVFTVSHANFLRDLHSSNTRHFPLGTRRRRPIIVPNGRSYGKRHNGTRIRSTRRSRNNVRRHFFHCISSALAKVPIYRFAASRELEQRRAHFTHHRPALYWQLQSPHWRYAHSSSARQSRFELRHRLDFQIHYFTLLPRIVRVHF